MKMDGLGKLGALPGKFPLEFEEPRSSFAAVSIVAKSLPTANFETIQQSLPQTALPAFFQEDNPPGTGHRYTLRLVSVPTNGQGVLFIDQNVFEDILRETELDREGCIVHLMRIRAYGFFHCTSSSKKGAITTTRTTYFLGTSFIWTAWTTTTVTTTALAPQESTLLCSTKCLILDPTDFYAGPRMTPDRQPNGFDGLSDVVEYLDLFSSYSPSPLYLPFVLGINSSIWWERSLIYVLVLVRIVESKTGHGSWGSGNFEEERDSIPKLTAELGSAQNRVGNIVKHLEIFKDLFEYMENYHNEDDERKGEDKRLIDALRIQRQQMRAAEVQCAYLEGRIRNQSAVLFAFLTHEDSKYNIEIANASRKLAEATRRDGSSMKTIAVLTMAFLPGTFLAALFSIPTFESALIWGSTEEANRLGIYWAFTVPITLATFAIWAGLTQGYWIKGLLPNGLTGRSWDGEAAAGDGTQAGKEMRIGAEGGFGRGVETNLEKERDLEQVFTGSTLPGNFRAGDSGRFRFGQSFQASFQRKRPSV
ncbi:hypothetical protein QBC35DRAFT_30253 [Podospora australis]|uniref:Uncharacterized protein n=1 Tax=Podospora australis TaxID=1536484 RepID=A0AAN7AGP0_9PEZI|nr:hypothetical protein QBC35DRAFT_30253 [Podospora australis]